MTRGPGGATGFAELVLVVDDVPRAAAFYREVVGLAVERGADESWAWFWTGAPHASARLALRRGTLLFEEHSPRGAAPAWGPVHFALTVPRSELGAATERVRDAGVTVHGPTRLEWMSATSQYFYDPDGNLVEFWSPDEPDS